MFRSPRYLETTVNKSFLLDTPLSFPGNSQYQKKIRCKFKVTDRDNWFDWYNAYFRVEYTFEAAADGANVAAGKRTVGAYQRVVFANQ